MAAVVPRRRVTVSGVVTCVRTRERPWVRTDVEIWDCTGVVVRRFLGRSSAPGSCAVAASSPTGRRAPTARRS